ncbi:hypothetical protein EIP91_005571 [Steccherinum ochraceum]|uniref:Uncharacterized protein n=1 Tax=Steccherinum ochraceum TaxID=92696 RepID=A0A4R0RS03_9APHY|nr:hypothetical protein EIP91_005571 [Steccherinum ochraceum]
MALEVQFRALQLSVNAPTTTTILQPKVEAARLDHRSQSIVHVRATAEDIEASREQNALVPLLQLPSELLLAIIHHYVGIHRKPSKKPLSGKLYTWLRVTHVCHHLRSVALADPKLWSTIYPANPDFVSELLVRSQQIPLTLEFNHLPASESGVASVRTILDAFDRIGSMSYIYSSTNASRIPPASRDASQLRSLAVRNAEAVHPRSATVKIPLFIDNCKMPALEKLDVVLLPFPTIQTLFRPTLTKLSMSTSTIPGIASALLKALEDMPLLETLKLHQVLPESNVATKGPSDTPIVSLPRLRSLYVSRSGAVECAEFLDHLSFPSTTTLHLDLRPCGRQLWFSVVIPALSAKFKDREQVQTVCIHTPWNSDVQVAVWSRAMSMDEFETQELTPDLCITMYGHHGGTIECDETLVSLTCDLPLTSVKTLFIGELNPYLKRNSSWIALFSPMTQTETLAVMGSSVQFIATVFHRPRERKMVSTGGGQVMPNLKCLSLRKVTFKEDADAAIIYPYDFIHNLCSCLVVRNERHKRLESLRVRMAVNLTEEDAATLLEVADQLDWDHKVHKESLRRQWAEEMM